MDNFIESISRRYSNLKFDVNKGERHWVGRAGYRGRLWFIPKKNGYFMQTTGQIGTHLNSEIKKYCGQGEADKKGYFRWRLVSAEDVERTIGLMAKLS